MYHKHNILIWVIGYWLLAIGLTSCRGDEIVVPSEYELLPIPVRAESSFAPNEPIGMYLLNEGNMGSNKASIDYVDFCNGYYIRNIYGERNPNVIKELGDVGNDIQVYGNRLYAVINCSHKVEVMDLRTCRRIGQVDIPNCRYIRFKDGKAYISSYVGPVSIDPNAQLGAIFEVDTATLRVTRQVTVGYQPEEFEIIGNHLYVANSGGYHAPDYDSTLSVVDLTDFRQIKKIPVCVNPHRVRKDQYDRLWITSRGDHKDVQPQLVCFQPISNSLLPIANVPAVSEMVIFGDSMCFYGSHWSDETMSNTITYGVIDIRYPIADSQYPTSDPRPLITDGTEKNIKIPYGIQVNPYNGDIYITDAKNYVSSGQLHCYSREGKRKWSVRTGDIPAHMCFVYR
ncbi:MAG: YncE family protein [Paludibacteraceae bacterium]|nr:YncE family protein [Paludibacteraceae bacterium]